MSYDRTGFPQATQMSTMLSYKASHFLQYPPGTESLSCYLESRGGDYPESRGPLGGPAARCGRAIPGRAHLALARRAIAGAIRGPP